MSKKVLSIVTVLVIIIEAFSPIAFSESSEVSAKEYSEMLKTFSESNFQYAFSDPIPNDEVGNLIDNIQLNRLIVSTNTNNELENYCGAVDKLEGYNNWHILQYDSVDNCNNAYEYYLGQDYVRYVEYDEIISGDNITTNNYVVENISDDVKKMQTNWASERIEADACISELKNNQVSLNPVIVALIDTGIEESHSYFTDESRILTGNRPSDNAPSPEAVKYWHGTRMCGLIVRNTPSNVKIKSYNYFYYKLAGNDYGLKTTLANEVKCAVEDGADVINLSLTSLTNFSSLKDEIKNAIDNNITVVVSSGNYNSNANYYFPASYSSAITVSSVDSNLKPWIDSETQGSNYGSVVDISAPGDNASIWTTDLNGGFCYTGGTSAAAALVSSAVAIIRSFNSEISVEKIEEIIKSTAYVPEGWDAENYGAGIVNFMNILEAMLQITEKPKIELIKNEKSNPEKAVITSSPNAKIYYTTNNTDPVVGKSALYTEPIDVTGVDIIKAIAVEEGMLTSETASKTIDITVTKTVRYKGSLELPAAKRSDFKSCYVAKEDIVTYEGDGTIKAHKVGKTDVIVFVNCGKKVTYEITVEYEWWQRMIRIFLLGFLWY
ncbi:MAG: S8 family serine peptidase [Clostridia bacterium]|nr:S8 family serine peptidase [Clostridia bacterium]